MILKVIDKEIESVRKKYPKDALWLYAFEKHLENIKRKIECSR